jgi:hypothetical protein
VATSGTVGTTVFDTRKVIDNAYRGCRLNPQRVSGEMITVAMDQLFLLLSEMANTGVPLWCQTKFILPMYLGVGVVPCPVGTVDVLNVNLRNLQILAGDSYAASEGTAANAFDQDISTECVQTTPDGYIDIFMSAAAPVTTFGLLPGASGTWSFQLQYSDDSGANWTAYETYASLAVVDREWLWYDYAGLGEHAAYRLRATGGTVLNVREIVYGNTPNEIPFARLNKDDYFNLPNKTFQGRPLQFWMDRQRSVCNMNIWPTPNNAAQFQQITGILHRQIMDVGTMRQEIEVPQRWYNAIVAKLSAVLAQITPEVDLKMIDITQAAAMKAEKLAWMEERDNSPMYLQPDLWIYTR